MSSPWRRLELRDCLVPLPVGYALEEVSHVTLGRLHVLTEFKLCCFSCCIRLSFDHLPSRLIPSPILLILELLSIPLDLSIFSFLDSDYGS